MASNYIERFIRIFVKNDAAISELKQTEQALDDVDASAKKVEKSMDNTRKSVLDNGGAMGILGEITGGLSNTFKDAVEAIELTGISLKGLNGVIAASVIGAFVVIITELVANWDKWSGVIDGSTSRLKELNGELDILRERYTDLTSSQQTMLEFMQLEGASLDEIGAKRRENFEEAQALLIQQLKTQEAIALEAIKSASMWDRLTNGLLGNWEKVKEENKKVRDITRELTKLTDEYYKAEKSDENAKNQQKVEASKKRQLEIDKERLDVLKKINDSLKKESDIIISGAREIEQALAKYGSLGPLDDELTGIVKTFEKVVESSDKYNKLLQQLEATYKKIKNPTKEQTQAYEEERSKVSELVKTYERFTESFDDLYKTIFNKGKEEIKALTDKSLINSQINDLEIQYLGLQNQIFDFENGYFNTKLGWDNTILSKEKNINDIYENRKKILDLTLGTEINNSAEITKSRKQELDSLQAIYDIAERNANREGATQKEIDDALFLKGKLLQAEKNYTEALTTEIALRDKYKLDSATLTTEAELSLYDLQLEYYKAFLEEKAALDDEYYNNLLVTSSNLQGFLSQLQDENLVKSRDLRNVLLVAEKGLAIANVVIDTIRANRVLRGRAIDQKAAGDSALAYAVLSNDPRAYASAGLHYKAAATATAGIALNNISAGAAIGGILATTITSWNRSGGAGGSGGGAAGGAPQFNIVGSSGTNQLAATIAARQNQPVNAYVVGTDVSTQQSLDRNRVQNATFL